MNRKQRFAQNMLNLSNKSRSRNVAEYCAEAMPYLYSAMLIVLYENYGFREKRLNKFLNEVYGVWSEYTDAGTLKSLIDICEERTGIRIEYREDDIQRAVIDGGGFGNGNTEKEKS